MEFLGAVARRILKDLAAYSDAADDGQETCRVEYDSRQVVAVGDVLYSSAPDTPTEWVFLAVICVLFVALGMLWVEYKRLKKTRSVGDGRARTVSEMLSEQPHEMKEQLQETIREIAEFMVPMRRQRFRKRDRVYFHGKRFMRKMAANMQRVGSDPMMIPKNFIKYVRYPNDVSFS